MSDLRSPLAKARDDYFESEEGKRISSGTAYGQWLKNRLELAFLAGANWAEKQNYTVALGRQLKDKIAQRIAKECK